MNDKNFVSSIVHNAGVYNGIVAVGVFASASADPSAFRVRVALLSAGIVAGLFGTWTLTKQTIVQALVGVVALVTIFWVRG
jgi:uncharacterized membrane protein